MASVFMLAVVAVGLLVMPMVLFMLVTAAVMCVPLHVVLPVSGLGGGRGITEVCGRPLAGRA